MSQQLVRISALVGLAMATVASGGCVPKPLPDADAPRRRHALEVTEPFLEFHGRADQMGDLNQVAQTFRVIAVDADPLNNKFSPEDIKVLRAGGKNIVLGILNIGFCDRDQSYWLRAAEGVMPCVAFRLRAQIGERADRPREVWMDLDDQEYQYLIGEYEAPRIGSFGVDGFLLDGLDILDHGPDDDAPCDDDCVTGGLELLSALRKEFPDLIFVMQGGLSPRVREARVNRKHVASLIDGIIGEEVYTPTYNPVKEANLLAWKKDASRPGATPLAVITQDYVKSCSDRDWAEMVAKASRSHGFSPAVTVSPIQRAAVCYWNNR